MMYKCSFKIFLPLMLLAVLPSCSTFQMAGDGTSDDNSAESPVQPAVVTKLHKEKAVEPETNYPDIDLDSDMLFNLLVAEFAGNAGDINTSLKFYNEASKSIEDGRIAQRAAYIALYGKKYDEALVALDRWRELEASAPDLSRMYAVTYLKLKQPENAAAHIVKILSHSPGTTAEKAVSVKNLLVKEADIKDAYVVLQKLNGADPDGASLPEKNKHLLILQSRYAAQLKQYEEALLLLDEALLIDPSMYDVLIIKAKILLTQGKQSEATELMQQVLGKNPDNLALRQQYARMLVEQRRLNAALLEYKFLYKKTPDNSDVAISLALLYIETKQLDEAIEVLKHLIVSDKKVDVANYYLGRIAQNKKNDKRAISYYLKIEKGNYKFDAQMRAGILLSDLGKPDVALAKLEALAEAQTEWSLRVKAYLAQGEVLRNQHRYKDAVEMYSRALQQKRDDTTLLYARGLMAEKVDRLDMAEADLLQVISQEPKNANALNALGYTLADRTVRYKEALTYIKRAAELVPDDPAILDSLGWVSFRLGNMEDALKWLSQAFQKLEDAEIAAHYGEVLWHNSQKQRAREVWKIGQEKNADNPVLVETLKRIQP